VSSVSSFDSQKHHHPAAGAEPFASTGGNLEVHSAHHQGPAGAGRSSALSSPSSLLPPPSAAAHSLHRSSISGGQSRPIVIRKGIQGFGFTIRSVRVYLSEVGAKKNYREFHVSSNK
jgi:hypothetical protein